MRGAISFGDQKNTLQAGARVTRFLKLHVMADGPTGPNAESLDQNQPAGSPGFLAGT